MSYIVALELPGQPTQYLSLSELGYAAIGATENVASAFQCAREVDAQCLIKAFKCLSGVALNWSIQLYVPHGT